MESWAGPGNEATLKVLSWDQLALCMVLAVAVPESADAVALLIVSGG